MKRVGNLYDKVISIDNLRLADKKARRGKTHSWGVQQHDRNREANLAALHEALKYKTFRTSEYESFTIFEPKERLIKRLPYYPDRIVHHAIMNVLEPIWVSVFTYNTYSCIKGRGIEGCAKRTRKIINSYKGKSLYCLKIDIRKYYPSIDHEVLKNIVRRKIKDNDLLWLIDEIIDSSDGLPIGNYLSQYLANLNLAYFMHWVNEVLKLDAVVYADDICFFADSKETLRLCFVQIEKYLSEKLRLTVKDNWQIFPVAMNRYDKKGRAVDYVGYKFYRKQTLIRKTTKRNFCRAVSELKKRTPAPEPMAFKQTICPWLGWAKHSDSRHLLQTIIPNQYHYGIL